MRFDMRFSARMVVAAGLFASAVSVFGLVPVHAQTTPAMPAAQGPVRRMSIDDAVATEEHNLLHPGDEPRRPYVTRKLADARGPFVAVSDYMRAVPDLISRWVPGDWTSLGTDGFGLSDTRHALRRHFNVDAESIAVTTLRQLAARGEVRPEVPAEAARKYAIEDVTAAPVGETGGDS